MNTRRIFLLPFVALTNWSAAHAGDDWEYWSDYRLSYGLPQKMKMMVEERLRFRNDMNDWYFTQTHVGLWWEARKWLEVGGLYSYSDTLSSSDHWLHEHRVCIEATGKWGLGPLKVSDRNRIEQRWFEGGGDGQRYRNMFKLDWPLAVRNRKITPFVYDEIFYDFVRGDWARNRLCGGVTLALNKHWTLELYCLRQWDRPASDWRGRNVLGTALRASF